MTRRLFPLVLNGARGLAIALSLAAARAAELPPDAQLSTLDNGTVKVGIDLNRGGAIAFLARQGGENVINNFDLGRQVQLSFFSGPVPFSAEGQQPAKHWEHIGWNPIQAGDDFGNASPILEHRNDGKTIYVKTQPLQWPLRKIAGECTFESWLELDGATVKARARLNNARSDRTQYRARLQELPAAYANASFSRVVSYTGARPFSGEALSEIPRSKGPHPWSFWEATENWSALLDAQNFGLGLITPGRVHFTGGFAGKPGPNDTTATHTGYLAGQAQEILDHNITFEFRYELVVGTLDEIRARAATHRPAAPPVWTFAVDRQGWHYLHANDRGWPIAGALDIPLTEPDPQLISPYAFWNAEDAPFLVIDAAFQTPHRQGVVFWQTIDAKTTDKTLSFPITADGEFHRHVVRLADSEAYRGGIVRLRIDPVPAGSAEAWVKIRSIRLTREP